MENSLTFDQNDAPQPGSTDGYDDGDSDPIPAGVVERLVRLVGEELTMQKDRQPNENARPDLPHVVPGSADV